MTCFTGAVVLPSNAFALWKRLGNNTTIGNMVLDENFKEFLRLLNANDVKYLVVGDFAVAYHGYPRYTKDIDFWIWADPDNAEKLLQTISEFGLVSGLRKEDLLNADNVIQLGFEPNRIDIIVQLDGVEFEECFEHRQEAVFEGIKIHFINLDDLIKNKLATGRIKDKADAKSLEKKRVNIPSSRDFPHHRMAPQIHNSELRRKRAQIA